MGSRSNADNKFGNKRVEVPVYQKKDGSYGAKSELQPVKVTATKRHPPARQYDPHAAKKVPKVHVKVDHSILKDGSKFE